MTASELIKKAMEMQGVKTRYALSKVTGISESHLGHYAKDSRWPSNTHAKRLAEAAGLDWAEVIAELEIEQAKDEQTRSEWVKALASIRRISGFAEVWMLAYLASLAASFWGLVASLPTLFSVLQGFARSPVFEAAIIQRNVKESHP